MGASEQDAELGFSRPEMHSAALAGTAKTTFARHVCLAWGKAEDWPPDVPKDLPDGSLPKKVEEVLAATSKVSKEKVKLQIIEATGSVQEGDVLIFPDYVKLSAKTAAGLAALKNYLGKAREPGVSRCIEDVEDLHGGFWLVCSHKSRDARCGFCGPRLAEAFQKEGASGASKVEILKCSHVGGHVYAGNVIGYTGPETPEGEDGHWYGYITPSDAPLVVSGKAVRSKLWRGRIGLDEAGAVRERRLRRAKDASPFLLGAVFVAAAAVMILRKRKQ